jgi:hypothetical protein
MLADRSVVRFFDLLCGLGPTLAPRTVPTLLEALGNPQARLLEGLLLLRLVFGDWVSACTPADMHPDLQAQVLPAVLACQQRWGAQPTAHLLAFAFPESWRCLPGAPPGLSWTQRAVLESIAQRLVLPGVSESQPLLSRIQADLSRQTRDAAIEALRARGFPTTMEVLRALVR